MKRKVIIIDYQLSNLFSVNQACEYLGYSASIISDPKELSSADYAILPGVGAFGDAMAFLNHTGMTEAIRDYVGAGKPLMGICLGLQLLLEESEEFGSSKGIGLIPGAVKKFIPHFKDGNHYKVPQIQWNVIEERERGLWNGTPLQCCKPGDYMYFVHSYYADPSNLDCVLSETTYGDTTYCSSIFYNNIFATQFHPEKSGLYGVNIYKEWFRQNGN